MNAPKSERRVLCNAVNLRIFAIGDGEFWQSVDCQNSPSPMAKILKLTALEFFGDISHTDIYPEMLRLRLTLKRTSKNKNISKKKEIAIICKKYLGDVDDIDFDLS